MGPEAQAAAAAPAAAVAGRWDGALLFGLCLCLYVALGQRVFYKTDGVDLLWLLHEGRDHPWHVGYLPVLSGLKALLAPLGLSTLRIGEVLSALGTALAVFALHGTLCTLGAARAPAAAAALLLGLNPGTLLFATVVEFHGPLLGAVGVATWWTARQSRAPGLGGMALLALLCHGAFLLHGSALLLPALLLPWWLALRAGQGTLRRDLGLALWCGFLHGLLFLCLPTLFPVFYGDYADLGAALARETSIGRPQGLEWLPAMLVQEWLVPLLPLSVAFVPALFRRELRLEALALLVGLLPFLVLCTRQVVFEPECGAYLLPLLPLAARLGAVCWHRRAAAALVLLSAVLALGQALRHEARLAPAYDAWHRELAAAAGADRPLVLLATHRELGLALARLDPGEPPGDPGEFVNVRAEAMRPREELTEAHLSGMVAWLTQVLAERRAVVLSVDTLAALGDPAAQTLLEKPTLRVEPSARLSGPVWLQRLRSEFELVPAGPRFLRLQTRPR